MKKLIVIFMTCHISVFAISQPQFIAHRGASHVAPENTLAALNKAWELNADASEIDVRLTKDQKVIVSHDNGTKRVAGQQLLVNESKAKALRKLDIGSWKSDEFKGEKFPFLKEAIKTVPEGKELFVEVKCGTEIFPSLEKDCRKSGKLDQLVFISFNWDVVTGIKKLFPDNKCYWLCSDKDLLEEKFLEVAEKDLNGINLRSSLIDEEVIKRARGLGVGVYAWTVNNPDIAKRLMELDVDGITTNRPAWLKEQLRNN